MPLFVPQLARPRAAVEQFVGTAGTASLVALAVIALRHQTVDVRPATAISTLVAIAVGVVLSLRGWSMPVVTVLGVATQVALVHGLGMSG
jgi:hypothetical protein